MNWKIVSDADGFAIAMTAMLALAFLTVATLLIAAWRHSRRRNEEVSKFIEELTRPSRKSGPPGSRYGQGTPDVTPDREPWERDGDWWKQ